MEAGNPKGLKAEINVTPLVDVVLVLLIIFMVVTPMLQESRAVELPEAAHIERHGEHPSRLSVVIDHEGVVWLDGVRVEPELLRELVQVRLEADPGLELVLKGDRRLDYDTVRQVMTSCRKAGGKRLILATKERPRENNEAGAP